MASPAYSMTWSVPPAMPILPMRARIRSLEETPARALAAEDDLHGLRARLQQALRGQHVLDFAGADAEGQRAEGAVRRGVAIAADDGQAGLGDAELGTDDVDDALVAAGHVKERDAVAGAILRQRFDLQARVLVHDGQMAILGGDGMVHHREGEIGAAHLAAGGFQAGKGLRGGDFVNQVAVNVDEGRLARGFAHHVRVPDFFVHGLGAIKTILARERWFADAGASSGGAPVSGNPCRFPGVDCSVRWLGSEARFARED